MNKKTDKNTIAAFVLGIIVCAAVLSPLWLFGGIDKKEATDIVVEKIYSDYGRDGYIVEAASAEKVEDNLYRVDASVRALGDAFNITYLVTGDGKLILDESEKIEDGKDPAAGKTAPAQTTAPAGSPEGVHVKGPSDARVTIIEFSDFECSYCARFYNDAYKQILAAYPNDVKIIFKDFPLSFHQQATPAAEAAECAGAQGKYWEYHDMLFEKQQEWSAAGRTSYLAYAGDLGLDVDAFTTCIDAREFKANVEADFREGRVKGVSGTPAFFVNDKLLTGAQPFSVFQAEIDAALAAAE